MTQRGIRRWALLGALVSTALLAPACGQSFPKAGTDHEGLVNDAPNAEPSGAVQQQGTGGSGFQQQSPGEAPLPVTGQGRSIGAPGYSDPRELLSIDHQGRTEPNPQRVMPNPD